MAKDYYRVLGVGVNADADTIKKAYRKLAKEYHPDLHPGDAAAEERFKEIGEAWEILGDENKRKEYDREREKTSGQKQPFTAKKESKTASSRPMDQDIYNNMMGQFDHILGRDAIKKRADQQSAAKSPMDTTRMFEGYMRMGMHKKKKP